MSHGVGPAGGAESLQTSRRILDFLGSDGITLSGKRVGQIGGGDGGVALGLQHLGKPAHLVAFSARDVGGDSLFPLAAEMGVPSSTPSVIEFVTAPLGHLGVRGGTFDVVVAWCVLEWARPLLAVCREMARVLKPGGLVVTAVSPRGPRRDWEQRTLDEVQRALLSVGIFISKVEIDTPTVQLPPGLGHFSLSEQARGEARLLASPTLVSTVFAEPARLSMVNDAGGRGAVGAAPVRTLAGAEVDAGETVASQWFGEHYGYAADEIIGFLDGEGLSLSRLRVADIGCGDGIIDLGVAVKSDPRELVGFDLNTTDVAGLRAQAQERGVAKQLPRTLRFAQSSGDRVPAPDQYFDAVFSWSAFEHVTEPVAMAREIRRILRPEGFFFLQLWPFYRSEFGSHLQAWVPTPFAHLLYSLEEVRQRAIGELGDLDPRVRETASASLNGTTLEDLQRALLAGGLEVRVAKLLASGVHVPPQLAHCSLVDLVVGGVYLLAGPG